MLMFVVFDIEAAVASEERVLFTLADVDELWVSANFHDSPVNSNQRSMIAFESHQAV